MRKPWLLAPIALKRLNRILLGRAAYVAALGVQNDGHLRCHAAHVFHQPLKLAFGTVRGKVGNLGFEGHHQVGRGVHDRGAKIVNLVGVAFEFSRKLGGLRVQPDAQH